MPIVPPETYRFHCFVNSSVEPPVISAYWESGLAPSQVEVDALLIHEEAGHLDFSLSVTRTVTENQIKLPVYTWQFKADTDDIAKAAAKDALAHLQELYSTDVKEFFIECWTAAHGHFTNVFPKVFPR